MSKDYTNDIERMKSLINYGKTESKKVNESSILEYHQTGADGKTYGILREGTKYYIKVAPKKDTALVAEDYDYIGGYLNKKEYEYNSYNVASKQFGLKMKSLQEANSNNYSKQVVTESQFKQKPDAEWTVNETKEMRREIERMNEISRNVNIIQTKGTKQLQETKCMGDVCMEGGDAKEADKTYSKKPAEKNPNEKVSGMETGNANDVDENGGNPYSKKPKMPKNECKKGKGHKVQLTMEQVLAWSKSKDFMDKSNGTHVGSSAPYTNKLSDEESNQGKANTDPIVNENDEAVYNSDTKLMGNDKGTNKNGGDKAPYTQKVNTIYEGLPFADAGLNPEDAKALQEEYGFEGVDDIDLSEEGEDDDVSVEKIADMKFEGNDNMKGIAGFEEKDPENEFPQGSEFEEEEPGMPLDESVILEVTLDDFGKHPAFGKEAFTTPEDSEDNRFGRDWNDKSVKGRKRYAQQIGSSAPYTEEVVDMLTDAVMSKLNTPKDVTSKKKI